MMFALRQALRYVTMFNGQLFVIVPDPAVQKEFLQYQLPDVELLSRLGIRIHLFLSNGAVVNQPSISVSKVAKADVAEVACQYAVAKKAAKVIFMLSSDGIHDGEGRLLNCLDREQATELLSSMRNSTTGNAHQVISGSLRKMLECTISISNEVERVHFINASANSLLMELFTGSGCGTLLTSNLSEYTQVRPGTREDASVIELFLQSVGIPLVGSIKPQEFQLACKDDEILGAIRGRASGKKLVIDCAAVQPGLPVDEYFDKLLSALLASEINLALGGVTIKLCNCHDWILLSPVPARHGFTKKVEGGDWLLGM